MAKKKRTHNPNRVKASRSYCLSEIKEIFGVHHRTVQSWLKKGLKVIDKSSRPYLVSGQEIKCFLKDWRKRRRHPLKIGEFFCTTCRGPRRSHPDKLVAIITGRKIGKNSNKYAEIKGVCEACNKPLVRFSSEKQVQELKKKGVILSVLGTLLIDIGDNTVNTDIERREKMEKVN